MWKTFKGRNKVNLCHIMRYYVSKKAQENSDHEVHKENCDYLPEKENRIYLGSFSNCSAAARKARREHYKQVNGCYYCSNSCHTQ